MTYRTAPSDPREELGTTAEPIQPDAPVTKIRMGNSLGVRRRHPRRGAMGDDHRVPRRGAGVRDRRIQS